MIEMRRFQRLWKARLRLEMWYSCVIASALMAVAQFAAIEVDRHILGRPLFALRLPYLFVGLACLIVMLYQRNKLGFKAIQLTIVALTLAVLPYIWISQAAYVNSQHPWIPFYGFQITALAVVMFRYGDGVRFNTLLLVVMTIEAAAFWGHFHLGSEPLLAQSGYIWNLLLTGLCAATLLLARYLYERTLKRFIAFEARAAASEMTARVFLSVRDRANSPLQTLEIGLALLKREQPKSARSDALLSALKKLVDLHEVFKHGGDETDWIPPEEFAELRWLKEE